MNWNKRIRQSHRWISIAFTLAVVGVTVAAATQEEPAEWVFFSPLLPLALLMLTGLYLFALPFVVSMSHQRSPDSVAEPKNIEPPVR